MDMQDQPRLSIHHLLVGMACVAVYLAVGRVGLFRGANDQQPLLIIDYIRSGVALSGIVLLFSRRWKGQRFPVHAGEYLLVLSGVSAALWAAFHCAVALGRALMGSELTPPSPALMIYGFTFFLIHTGLCLWFAKRVEGVWWKSVFVAFAILSLNLVPLPWRRWSYFVAYALIIGAIVADRRADRHFPWTHWLGAILPLTAIPFIVAQLLM